MTKKLSDITFTGAVQGATLLILIGMWAGGIDNLKEQTLMGFEAIERQNEKNHSMVLNILADQDVQIDNINDFLTRKYPREYIAPLPHSQAIRRVIK